MSVDSNTPTNWTAPAPSTAADATRNSVIEALKKLTALGDKRIETFLQGSYANHTNVRADSDVDIVVMSHRSFFHNIDALPDFQQKQFHAIYSNSSYGPAQLRADVHKALEDYYTPRLIEPHNKCIRVIKRDGYLDADVVPAFVYRHYNSFSPLNQNDYVEGTVIFPADGSRRVVNFPKEHIKHGTSKHAVTSQLFKPTVRQLKRLKHKAIEDGHLEVKKLPGYLLECLTFNVPPDQFINDDRGRMATILVWLADNDFSNFKSVDSIHKLFVTDPGKFSIDEAKGSVHNLIKAYVN